MALSAKTRRRSAGRVCENHKPFWPPAAKPVKPRFLISYPHNPAASKWGNTVLPRESIRMRPANRGDNSTAAGTRRSPSRYGNRCAFTMRRYALSTRIRSGLAGSSLGNCDGADGRPSHGRKICRTAPRLRFWRLCRKSMTVPLSPSSLTEKNVMAIATALDDDLVGAAPQHRASSPALAPVDLIAETDSKLAQINLPFEGVEFAILVHHLKHLFFPYCPFFLVDDHWL